MDGIPRKAFEAPLLVDRWTGEIGLAKARSCDAGSYCAFSGKDELASPMESVWGQRGGTRDTRYLERAGG